MLEGNGKPDYQSYVLRLWMVGEEDRLIFRASLQSIPDHDGPRRGFVNLRALFAFLEDLEQQARPPDTLDSTAPRESGD
jgi:hypothetical protein